LYLLLFAMQSLSTQSELFEAAREAKPAGLVYQPDFITREDEQSLLQVIDGLVLHDAQYKQFTARRRIASFGGQYDFSGMCWRKHPSCRHRCIRCAPRSRAGYRLLRSNSPHVLVAQYRPGTPLGWHRDVAQFELVVGVSLAGRARMRFRPYPLHANKREGVFALELEPRSAYILRDDARWRWQHSVAPTKTMRYSDHVSDAARGSLMHKLQIQRRGAEGRRGRRENPLRITAAG
jgi:alkylated DNA repair dioxygenase AlkB